MKSDPISSKFGVSIRWSALICVAAQAVLLLSACSSNKPGDTSPIATDAESVPQPFHLDENAAKGLTFSLSETSAPDEDLIQPRLVTGEELTGQDRATLLARLPDLPDEKANQTDFAFRKRSKPAPRTGDTIRTAFPPDATLPAPAAASDGPMELLRFAPDGEVGLAPKLSVTFSQPVVAVSGQEDAAKTHPVTIEPAVEGKWRWIGTRTALFEPSGERFPMATDYKVAVVPGLKSATGNKLKEASGWSFSTPAVTVNRVYPTGNTQPLRPLMFMEFNQRVEREKILEFVQLTANDTPAELELASDAQVKEDKQISRLVDNARPGQWVAFKPTRDLPAATHVQIRLAKGAPSPEGPKLSTGSNVGNFRTYDPLRVERHSCDTTPCHPISGWYFSFNNPLDNEDFSADKIRISPEIKDAEIRSQYSGIYINGKSKARTDYKVTLDGSIKDKFGQTLGEDIELTLHVGPSPPMLGASAGAMTILDPALDGHFPIFSTNYERLQLQVYRVSPANWTEYLGYLYKRQRYRNRNETMQPPGKKVLDKTIDIDATPDEMTQTLVDLRPALNQAGHGQLIVLIKPAPTAEPNDGRRYQNRIISWVQSTDIALDGFVSGRDMLAWTSRLGDGAPLEGIDISLWKPSTKASKTDASGLVTLPLPDRMTAKSKRGSGNILLAETDNDLAMLPERTNAWAGVVSDWVERADNTRLLWHVFDDRGMYQPGESVHIKGWLRQFKSTREDRLSKADIDSVTFKVRGPRGTELARGKAQVDTSGGFDFDFDLDDNVNLGRASITISSTLAETNDSTRHIFNIQEFRRPEFEVSVSQSGEPHFIGTSSTLSVDAHYYAGGALTGAPVKWTVKSKEGHYKPPGHDDYIFGRWRPWWGYWMSNSGQSGEVETFESHTDAAGEQHLQIRFDQAKPALPMVVDASAAVSDINQQRWSGSTKLVVHPSSNYVGIRSRKNFIGADESIYIDALVTDLDGQILADQPIEMSASRLDWRYENGEFKEIEKDTLNCTLTSAKKEQTCSFKPPKGGQWRITAKTFDARGRPNMSQTRVWVAGGKQPPSRRAQKDNVQLVPQKESYEAGETAKVMVISPFPGAEGLLTIRQNGVVSKERFHIEKQSHLVEVPISEADYPNITLQVDLVGKKTRTDSSGKLLEDAPQKPAYASGKLTLKIPPKKRVLNIDIDPHKARLSPGTKTHIDLEVRDAAGEPVANSEVALVAVDEAILALTGYELADPIASFYPSVPLGVRDFYLRQYLLLATAAESRESRADNAEMGGLDSARRRQSAPSRPQVGGRTQADLMPMQAEAHFAFAESKSASSAAAAPIALREDFRALALFAPSVRTDNQGKARVAIDLPDSLTRYRLMAVAVAGDDQFGKAETTMTARLPLMVRPSPPRFLNFGDRIEMPVVLQNQTDKAMRVKVAARASNLTFGKAPGRVVDVPANDRVEVRFKAVSDKAGTAVIQVAAASGSAADAATRELPVWTPATTEAFATYGTVDKDGAIMTQPIAPPSNSLSQFGGLEVTTSSTALQSLTDALLYLTNYPFECSEQIASRVMGIAALRDVLQAFEADKLPSESKLVATVERDIEELGKLQRRDGGFYLWSRRDRIRFPFVEVHITHALVRAKLKGFKIPKLMLTRAKSHLKKIAPFIPSTYSTSARNSVLAYSYYVLDLMGESVHSKARKLAAKKPRDEISLEAIGWLISTLADDSGAKNRTKELTRYVQNRVSETAGAAQFTTDYGGKDHVLMYSSRRTDAILLDAWMATQPKSDLIPKLVRGLLGHRVRGHWRNTQENVFVLLALDRYFQTYEKQTPDFVANLWLGDGFVGGHKFKGRTTDYKNANIPMKSVIKKSSQKDAASLVIQKDGPGRLYYRIGMSYALKSLKVDAADYGFTVERQYEAVDDPEDVTQRADDTWKVKLGSRVRVRLTMVAPARRHHVALVDPLPAGLEPLNAALAVTEDIPNDPSAQKPNRPYWWWYRPWYSHQNLRDERAEAFAPLVGAGVHEYSYVTRATTPGEFVVPPTKAEEMYSPETFGRTGTTRMVVK